MRQIVINCLIVGMALASVAIMVWAIGHDPTRLATSGDRIHPGVPVAEVEDLRGDPDVADEFDQTQLERYHLDRGEVAEVAGVFYDNGGAAVGADRTYRSQATTTVHAIDLCGRIWSEEQTFDYYHRGLVEYHGRTPAQATAITTYLREDFCVRLREQLFSFDAGSDS